RDGKDHTKTLLVHGDGAVEHPFHLGGQQGVFRLLQQGVGGQDGGGLPLGGGEGAGVGGEVGDLEGGEDVLPAAEKVAGAAGLQVVLGHRETVGGGAEELEPAAHRFGFVVADQKAPALGGTPAHPAPQLVQGGKAVPLGVLDDHDGGVG